MSDKLKPCPFCGSDDVKYIPRIASFVKCKNCLTEGPAANSEAEAARLWNDRAGDVDQPEIEYPTFSADGSKLFVIKNGEVKEYSMGEDYKRLFGEKGATDEV